MIHNTLPVIANQPAYLVWQSPDILGCFRFTGRFPRQCAHYAALRAAYGGCALYVLRHSGSE